MHLFLRPLRFDFVARESVHFPAGKASNVIRGALGLALKRSSCVPECSDTKVCPMRGDCAYALLFEPTANGDGPSGLADLPRPFVIRAAHLDGRTVATGDRFSVGINVFDLHPLVPVHLIRVFSRLIDAGLGPGRGSVELVDVGILTEQGELAQALFSKGKLVPSEELGMVRVALDAVESAAPRIRIVYQTPTDIRGQDYRPGEPPAFGTLAARIRDRVANLCRIYGGAALDLDYSGLGEKAKSVRLIEHKIGIDRASRTSVRKAQAHSIGGVVGYCDYEGDFRPFLGLLQAARWTGVGKHTTWGNGEILVSEKLADTNK